MFDKLKQIKELRDLQQEIKKESYEAEQQGTRIAMNGTFEVQEIHLNPELSNEQQEKALVETFNELVRKVQMAMAQRFRGMM